MLKPRPGMIALVASTALLPIAGVAGPAKDQGSRYHSPYSVKFTFPLSELTGDLEHGPRGDAHGTSTVPFPEWYSRPIRDRFGPWGPPARHYPAPAGWRSRSVEWQRQRVIAAALRFQGYDYQHHHLPDWDPPADWPWKETRSGHKGKGVDCSNFTAFAYNLALGLKPSSAVKKQAEQLDIPGPGAGRTSRAERLAKPASYAALVQSLRTGDLLFIRNKEGLIAHVVLWVGPLGQAPDQAPLILDSHGDGVKDSKGVPIPPGVQLRPFRERSWYFQSASHAIRYLRGAS